MPGSTSRAVERTQQLIGGMPTKNIVGLYNAVHGVNPGNESQRLGLAPIQPAWNTKPFPYDNQRGYGLVGQMYPNPPPIKSANGGIEREHGGTVYLNQDTISPTVAHEFEHARQYGAKQQPLLSDALAHELGPTILERGIFGPATVESNRKSPSQNDYGDIKFPGGYQPSMNWMHQQAQQHGILGVTPLAQSLGYKGKGPQSITEQIANNPQWLGLIANSPLPQQPKPKKSVQSAPSSPVRPMPNLTGYLP